jgi:type I restriction enzyme M protein
VTYPAERLEALERGQLHSFRDWPNRQPSTHAKTCVVFLENSPPQEDDVLEMAIADWCGHDSRGYPTIRLTEEGKEMLLDDLPRITEQLKQKLVWS